MLHAIMNSHKIKYEILKELISKDDISSRDYINIFIDYDSLIRKLYSTAVKETLSSLRDSELYIILSSETANIVAHYRHYFWSRYAKPTRFFIYHSSNIDETKREIYPEYKDNFYSKRYGNIETSTITSMINTNVNLNKILFKYIPNAHFIDVKDLDSNIVPELLIEERSRVLNLVLTTDKIQYQYARKDNTLVIHLAGDKSHVINYKNLCQEFVKEETDDSLYLLSIAVLGYKRYSLNKIKGIGKKNIQDKIFNKIEEEDKVYLSMSMYDNIESFSFLGGFTTIIPILKVIDTAYIVDNMKLSQKQFILDQLINLNNNRGIIDINAKFYELYPIMLIELMEGI